MTCNNCCSQRRKNIYQKILTYFGKSSERFPTFSTNLFLFEQKLNTLIIKKNGDKPGVSKLFCRLSLKVNNESNLKYKHHLKQ